MNTTLDNNENLFNNLLNEKKQLIIDQYDQINKLELIKKNIIKKNYEIANMCKKINNGHIWITEREEGPYGERFTYCKICNIDYNGDYFHN